MFASQMSLAQTANPTVQTTDVLVVGAGPAGLMLATQLARSGIPIKIIDDRAGRTSTGRADGLQPKTIETLRQLRLADPVLKKGARIYDISYWNSYPGKPLHRTSREVHYPPVVDVLDPYILLVHQGMVEDLFLDDMETRNVHVQRSSVFHSYTLDEDPNAEFPVIAKYLHECVEETVRAKYMVGCDGAHSAVRRSMPGVQFEGESVDVFWGVLDGIIATDFPDLWSKCAISSHDKGTILCIPRERNMTRLYIELSSGSQGTKISKAIANQNFVMTRAKEILAPFHVDWERVEWFGVYQIGQRVASSFSHDNRVFIAGDAAHTHSPKAAQGMNVSMHDTFNLAWKLSLVLSSFSPPSLLETYATERRLIAQNLIAFDYEHAKAFVKKDQVALAENFKTNMRFISGVGATYPPNTPITVQSWNRFGVESGELLTPARATRFIDANPVDLQLDVPLLNQFKIYFLTSDYHSSAPLLAGICEFILAPDSLLTRASERSLTAGPHYHPPTTELDEYVLPQRYVLPHVSRLFTFCIVTKTPRTELEFTDLPAPLREYKWTFYVDDLGDEVSPLRKWVGPRGVAEDEVIGIIVRPDGYVGAIEYWCDDMYPGALHWFTMYFKNILMV